MKKPSLKNQCAHGSGLKGLERVAMSKDIHHGLPHADPTPAAVNLLERCRVSLPSGGFKMPLVNDDAN